MQIDGGLLDFEFLVGDTEIDFAGLALKAADDFLFGGFEAGALDGVVGVGEVALVLFGGDFGLGQGLIESGLGLAESGLLLHEGFLGAGGIEFDDGLALFDGGSGRGHPGDAEVGDHGCGDLNGAFGLEFAAAANEDEEIPLAGGRGGENGGGLRLTVAIDAVGGAGDDGNEEEEAGPETQAGSGAGSEEGCGGRWRRRRRRDFRLGCRADGSVAHGFDSLAGASTTTAAERSGMQVGIGLIEFEDGSEGLDGAAEAGRGDRAGKFEVGGQGEVGIGVEVDGGFGAGGEGGAIGLADGTANQHFGGIEDADQGLAAIELIAFLCVAERVVAVEILVGDHAGEGSVDFELVHVGFYACEHDLLAVAL